MKLSSVYPVSGDNCNHIKLEADINNEVLEFVVEFNKLRQKYSQHPGGYRGLLISLLALYWIDSGLSLEQLPKKVKV